MLNIAVCDNEQSQRSEIIDMIYKTLSLYDDNYKIEEFNNGEELLSTKFEFNIYFLDIKMNNLTGIEAAKKIRELNKKAIIIFITAYKDYVFDAFDVQAFHYILKPINEIKFREVINLVSLKFIKEDKFIIAKTISQSTKISFKDIVYIESEGRKVKIHTTYDIIEYYNKISEIEKELNTNNFFRCHKSFIVNFMYVESYTTTVITLKNLEKIYISKYRLNEFSKAFMYYLKGEI